MPPLSQLTALYLDVLRSPGDTKRLGTFRQCWKQALPQLTDDQVNEVLAATCLDDVPSEWVSQIYEMLSEAEPVPSLAVDSRKAMIEANEHEETSIGRAFKDGLLDGLRVDLSTYFLEVPRVSQKKRQALRETQSVVAAWPECLTLVQHGLTPLDVFNATEIVGSLAKRLSTIDALDPTAGVRLLYPTNGSLYERPASEFVDYVVAEVIGVAHCGEAAAVALVRWLIDVARVKPYIFRQAYARQHRSGVVLAFDQSAPGSLLERWEFSPLIPTPTNVGRPPEQLQVPDHVDQST
jgi:hypothetical protein